MSDTVFWNLQMSVREGQLGVARDLMPEMVEATRFVYGEPSDEARAALDGFGAVYLGTFGGFSR